ncbi:MAG: hypothetical protein DPW16_22170 [Chloroflexi bacterium]|nr:hypothetical protein [Chloroflexota bacterium]
MATQIRLKLTMQSPLHIGGETRLNTSADKPLLKTVDGLPYIPATTLKGRLRHTLEQILHSDFVNLYQLGPLSDNMMGSPDTVHYLFGSPQQESRVYFEDLYLSGPPVILDAFLTRRGKAFPTTMIRTGVGINRRRRVAQDQILYSTEVFAPGIDLEFSGSVTALVDDEALIYLLMAGLRFIEQIGSQRSRGFGWCKVDILAPVYDETAMRNALNHYLLGDGE